MDRMLDTVEIQINLIPEEKLEELLATLYEMRPLSYTVERKFTQKVR